MAENTNQNGHSTADGRINACIGSWESKEYANALMLLSAISNDTQEGEYSPQQDNKSTSTVAESMAAQEDWILRSTGPSA